ncbi:cytochrome P450 [Polyporus arcularius HHB13444]|uniref:Cytochrome P450 n=1 Tax=Polyporus arcularius HHB13444 TaxID=1314778 RepID=A0A5C3NU19_9APHY|nr:cytochrome P450 [Polyporus arcularius HHB13444]
MSTSLLVTALAGVTVVVLWQLLRDYVIPSPLDDIPGPPSSSLLAGHLDDLTERKAWMKVKGWFDAYGAVYRVLGLLGERMVVTSDPKALHHILIKDVENWPKNLAPSDDLHLLLGPGLLTTEGSRHRRQRKMLNPVFSAAHLRHMAHIFYDIAHRMRKAVEGRVGQTAEEVDVNGWMARTTLEMLGQAGLGYSFDNFAEDSTDAYGESIKMFFPLLNQIPVLAFVVMWISPLIPERLIRVLLRLYPFSADLHRMLDISDTMARRSEEIIGAKKSALAKGDDELAHRVGEGKDIMSILLKANTAAVEAERLSDEELVAQMSTFILAGMDTTSNALSRTLHALAQHPSVQERLRAEILEAREASNGTDISHDDLVKLPYLDAVCRETLRLYAPVALITRRAAKDMAVPLTWPVRGKSGVMMTEIPVTKGTFVVVDIQHSNINKELWGEDALEWRPERWLTELPSQLHDARIPGVYSNLLTFSGGTRSCIGFKFSQLEMKIVLSVLLTAFKFELTDKPITWNSSAVYYPTMGEESTKPEMLLKVSSL